MDRRLHLRCRRCQNQAEGFDGSTTVHGDARRQLALREYYRPQRSAFQNAIADGRLMISARSFSYADVTLCRISRRRRIADEVNPARWR